MIDLRPRDQNVWERDHSFMRPRPNSDLETLTFLQSGKRCSKCPSVIFKLSLCFQPRGCSTSGLPNWFCSTVFHGPIHIWWIFWLQGPNSLKYGKNIGLVQSSAIIEFVSKFDSCSVYNHGFSNEKIRLNFAHLRPIRNLNYWFH